MDSEWLKGERSLWPYLSSKIWDHQCKKQTNKKQQQTVINLSQAQYCTCKNLIELWLPNEKFPHFHQLGDSFLSSVVLVAITSLEWNNNSFYASEPSRFNYFLHYVVATYRYFYTYTTLEYQAHQFLHVY